MRKSKIIIIALLMISILLTGCKQKIVITTGFDEGELVKISGKTITLNEVMILLLSEKESYDVGLEEEFWSIEYKDKTMISYFKEGIKDDFIRLNILSDFARSKNVTLTEEEKKLVSTSAKKYMELADAEAVKQYNISQKNVEALMEKILLSEKVYEKIVNDYVIEISDEEARVIYVNYIYVDANVPKAAEIAGEIYGKLILGADLGTVADKYDYATYGEGYMTRADFDEEQSKEVFKLKDGQVSSVIEQNGKLFIMKCINDYDETMTISNKALLIEEKKDAEFNKEYRPYEKSIDVEFNSELWESLNINDYQKSIGVNLYQIMEEAKQQ